MTKLDKFPESGCGAIMAPDGNIVGSCNADDKQDPASVTKLFTAYVIDKSLTGEAREEFFEDNGAGFKSMLQYRRTGEWTGMGTNDAAIEMGIRAAKAIGLVDKGASDSAAKKAFVEHMNDTAKELGMTNTQFVTIDGYPTRGHYSTATDMVRFGSVFSQDASPEIKNYASVSTGFKAAGESRHYSGMSGGWAKTGTGSGYYQNTGGADKHKSLLMIRSDGTAMYVGEVPGSKIGAAAKAVANQADGLIAGHTEPQNNVRIAQNTSEPKERAKVEYETSDSGVRKMSDKYHPVLVGLEGGIRTTAYYDIAGVLTIGAGHTTAAGGPKVTEGMTITRAEGVQIKKDDIGRVEAELCKHIKPEVIAQLDNGQYAALVLWENNTGGIVYQDKNGKQEQSGLLKALNNSDFSQVTAEMGRWIKYTDPDTGKKIDSKALIATRKVEKTLWDAGDIDMDKVHVVQMGDSVGKIASANSMSASELMSINGLNSDKIRAGQPLFLSEGVQVDAALGNQTIAAASQTDSKPQTNEQKVDSPSEKPENSYTIRKNDTLEKIASTLRESGLKQVTVESLAETNDIDNPHMIITGDTLKIPGELVASESTSRSYTMKAGDTIYSVAKDEGMDWLRVMKDNGYDLKTSRNLKPGDKIDLPSSKDADEVASSNAQVGKVYDVAAAEVPNVPKVNQSEIALG